MAVYTTMQPIKPKQRSSLFSDHTLTLRDEQEDSIKEALKYFRKKRGQKFLWNAKMRFGKTICALVLAKRMGELEDDKKVRRTLIVTHRPVVNESWAEDFRKVFGESNPDYHYATKFDDSEEGDFYALERSVEQAGKHYIFFASMQYLRCARLVGGDNDDQLKIDILTNQWDLVVIDEAHEGTRTSLGQRVIETLTREKTKVLHLSGTPFNLYEDFTDEQIYTWDYIKEQTAKREWPKKHPHEPPENNPYRELPDMEIRTYNLGKLVKENFGDDASFQFKEFFKTYQGQHIKPEQKGRFVHEDAVCRFLDLICADDENSHYPFSTDEYRTFFNHTLWVVPGVKEAKALENLLNEHEIFSAFDAIINVAGANDDDETRSDALDKVKKRIGDRPDQTYTITISCGRLTTGVTVRPWTAVFYLKGSENTSAATYMQTIFRVQSPYSYTDSDGNLQMKTRCYVFDFAPDRSLKMVAETAKFATLTQKEKSYASAATDQEKDVENMQSFLSFCPVISMEGSKMVEFEAEQLFEQLERVYVDRVVRNGFNDNSLYDVRKLMSLAPDELEDLNRMGDQIGKTTNMEKPKKASNINISKNGFTEKQKAVAERAKKKQKNKEPLTAEEEEALEIEKKRKAEERKERDNRITILRGISLRIPLMMYGAKVEDEEEGITLQNFTRVVDDASWAEFMPRGVDKKMFNKFKKCYNATVFVAAGKRYRQLAREADSMHIDERIQHIAEIFSYFHNPDKETVLTPWPVVNRHLSDCLGGYTFFNERFEGPNEVAVANVNGKLFDWVETAAPRYVDRGVVTREVFGDSQAKILEINSKTGLYPLYVAYSLYRQRCNDFVANGLIEDVNSYSVEEEQVIWDDILANNIYVICNTLMAQRITHRTLLGFRSFTMKEGTERVNIKSEKLIERAITGKDALISDLKSVGYWRGNRSKEEMKFSAVVGNPPYQVMDGGAGVSAKPVYNSFVEIARDLNPNNVSMIMPAKWYTDGKGLEAFRTAMLNDKRLSKLVDFTDSRDCFESVDIAGGICYFLWSKDYHGPCEFISKHQGESRTSLRDLAASDDFIRHIGAVTIIDKVKARTTDFFKSRVSIQRPFGLRTYVTPLEEGDIVLKYSRGRGPYNSFLISTGNEMIDKWKVIISYLTAEHAGQTDKEGRKRILSSLDILGPNEICTETYLVVDALNTKEEAFYLFSYLKTRFVRFLIAQLASTQHLSKEKFAFVPLQNFTPSSDIDWTQPVSDIDRQLYAKYSLTTEEQQFIESMIKPMD